MDRVGWITAAAHCVGVDGSGAVLGAYYGMLHSESERECACDGIGLLDCVFFYLKHSDLLLIEPSFIPAHERESKLIFFTLFYGD